MISRLSERNKAEFAALADEPLASSTPAASNELPASLEAAIKGLSVFHRTPLDGKERVLLAFAGETVSAWHHSPDETRRRLAAAWPELTGKQLDRALRGVAGAIRATGQDACRPVHSAWKSWNPDPFAARD